ncbi:MAG: response regulator [Candidatus Saccharibacteria bacterium]
MSSDTTVLIVEDDKWLAEQHARVISGAGYKSVVATNAIDAMHIIDKNLPDIMVLDVLLTGSTVFTLLHEMQSYADTGSIPVILCTNLASELSLSDLSSYGVKQIIDKTIMLPEDLVTAIRRQLL